MNLSKMFTGTLILWGIIVLFILYGYVALATVGAIMSLILVLVFNSQDRVEATEKGLAEIKASSKPTIIH
jgi:Flp pilus assembly protein TadB